MKHVLAVIAIVVLGFSIYYVVAFQQLDYELEAISLDEVGVLSATMTIVLRMSNPNPLPIYIPSTTFDIYLNGIYVGQGATSSMTVSGNGFNVIAAPITVSYTGISPSLVTAILSGGRFTVNIRGAASLFIVTIPFDLTETVSLS